jgi:enolase
VNNVNTTIKNSIVGKEFETVREVDQAMFSLDGTKNKTNLGANAIL